MQTTPKTMYRYSKPDDNTDRAPTPEELGPDNPVRAAWFWLCGQIYRFLDWQYRKLSEAEYRRIQKRKEEYDKLIKGRGDTEYKDRCWYDGEDDDDDDDDDDDGEDDGDRGRGGDNDDSQNCVSDFGFCDWSGDGCHI